MLPTFNGLELYIHGCQLMGQSVEKQMRVNTALLKSFDFLTPKALIAPPVTKPAAKPKTKPKQVAKKPAKPAKDPAPEPEKIVFKTAASTKPKAKLETVKAPSSKPKTAAAKPAEPKPARKPRTPSKPPQMPPRKS